MIVYNEGDYSFLNYKQSTDSLSTFFKITEVRIQHVESPRLGANSVIIYKEGKLLANGTPKAGGKIYLQNNYVAIDYDDTTSFSLIYSNGYRPQGHYDQLLPTKHLSTPFSRVVLENPKHIVMLKGGSVSIHSDFPYMGTKADYISLMGSDPVALYGVKEHAYFHLPFPIDDDELKFITLGKFIFEDTSRLLNIVPGVPGLIKNPKLTSHIASCREAMANWKAMDVNYKIATAFMAPVSSAYNYNAMINSALNVPNSRLYLKEQKDSGQDLSKLLAGIVLDESGLTHVIRSGIDKSNLLDYVFESSLLPENSMILLATEFQSLLEQYNLLYHKYREKGYIATLKSIKAMLVQADAICNQFLKADCDSYLEEAFKSISNYKHAMIDSQIDISVKNSSIATIDTLPLNETSDGSNASILEGHVKNIMMANSHDCKLTEKDIEDALKQPDQIKALGKLDFIGASSLDDRFSSMYYFRAFSASLSVLKEKIRAIPPIDEKWTVQHEEGIVRPEAFGIKSRKIQMIGSPGYCWVNHIKCTAKTIDFQLTIKFDDLDCYLEKRWSSLYNGIKGTIRDMLQAMQYRNVNFGNTRRYVGDKWEGCQTRVETLCSGKDYTRAKDYAGPAGKTVSLEIDVSCSFSLDLDLTNLPLCTAENVIPSSEFSAIDTSGKMSNAEIKKSLIVNCVNNYAAVAAFKILEPLFGQLSEFYEFQAIGSLGDNYNGVIVSINDLCKLGSVSESYINELVRLIDGIPSEEQRRALSGFRNQISGVNANFKNTEPIYILNSRDYLKGEAVTDVNAFPHYLLGAINDH